ncbi:SPOR domain-containing protein [Mucilaginibacter paludis]|uniref:Sporulation domain-containing protein n=1 Tax=Mucilaginibacter paludis DSM 18603 TaxID=714943 RepID=H1YEF5_9SPHI|nr:SPOR domain-containing protein [Mucilaginibacter paludis]EHQ27189.1 Sporulation domain-containing protein [Mucilaginibacter paludis DSM 18603]
MKDSNTISFLRCKALRYGIAFFMLISAATMAQTPGKVTVVKDARIDSLIALRIALSKAPAGANTGVYAPASGTGYRVQIFSGSNRSEAYNAQSKFNELYPELKTYIIYSEPNFKVRAGDFRTRLEASKLLEQLRSQFPSLFIISEKINLPKIGNTND